jgi:tripartite-type tricarboxylate transporter receptor subunit TctC
MRVKVMPMPLIRIIAAVAALLVATAPAMAQDWPTRPVTMVVPFAAGGAFDVIARVFSPHLSHSLGQQVIVENVGAAAGIVGTNRVAKATPDGYQFLFGSVGTHAYNQTLYKKLPYNAATDFAPVALIVEQPMVLLVRKDFPADTLQEFIAYAKANAAKLQYGSAGVGSTTHLSCALLNSAAGLDITHVPYRGGGPVTADLIAGQIHTCAPTAPARFRRSRAVRSKASRYWRTSARRCCRRSQPRMSRASPISKRSPGTRSSCPRTRPRPSSRSSTTRPTRR